MLKLYFFDFGHFHSKTIALLKVLQLIRDKNITRFVMIFAFDDKNPTEILGFLCLKTPV